MRSKSEKVIQLTITEDEAYELMELCMYASRSKKRIIRDVAKKLGLELARHLPVGNEPEALPNS